MLGALASFTASIASTYGRIWRAADISTASLHSLTFKTTIGHVRDGRCGFDMNTPLLPQQVMITVNRIHFCQVLPASLIQPAVEG